MTPPPVLAYVHRGAHLYRDCPTIRAHRTVTVNAVDPRNVRCPGCVLRSIVGAARSIEDRARLAVCRDCYWEPATFTDSVDAARQHTEDTGHTASVYAQSAGRYVRLTDHTPARLVREVAA